MLYLSYNYLNEPNIYNYRYFIISLKPFWFNHPIIPPSYKVFTSEKDANKVPEKCLTCITAQKDTNKVPKNCLICITLLHKKM